MSTFMLIDKKIQKFERFIIALFLVLMTVFIFLDVIHRTFAVSQSKTSLILLFLFKNTIIESIIWLLSPLINFFVSFLVIFYSIVCSKKFRASSITKKITVSFLILIVIFLLIKSFILIFPTGIPWSQRLSLCLFLWVAFMGSSLAVCEKKHLKVEALKKYLPKKIIPVAEILSDSITILFCLFLGTLGSIYVFQNFSDWFHADFKDAIFSVLPLLPFWLVNLSIPLALFIMVIRYSVRLFEKIKIYN